MSRIKDKTRESRLGQFGYVLSRQNICVGRRKNWNGPPKQIKVERPQRRYMDVMKDDMKVVGLMEKDPIGP